MRESKLAEVRVYEPSDEASLIALWEAVGLVVCVVNMRPVLALEGFARRGPEYHAASCQK